MLDGPRGARRGPAARKRNEHSRVPRVRLATLGSSRSFWPKQKNRKELTQRGGRHVLNFPLSSQAPFPFRPFLAPLSCTRVRRYDGSLGPRCAFLALLRTESRVFVFRALTTGRGVVVVGSLQAEYTRRNAVTPTDTCMRVGIRTRPQLVLVHTQACMHAYRTTQR